MGSRITILVSTMTGTAEMVAEELQQTLQQEGHEAELRMTDGLDASVFEGGGLFLICTSTYGFGSVPDNALDLVESLEAQRPPLDDVTYAVIALGDSTYGDTFCQGGEHFDKLLAELGARRAGELVRHDASSGEVPEELAVKWAVAWAREHLAPPPGNA